MTSIAVTHRFDSNCCQAPLFPVFFVVAKQGKFSEPEKKGALLSAPKLYRKNDVTAINTLFGAYNNIRECELLSSFNDFRLDKNSDTSICDLTTIVTPLFSSSTSLFGLDNNY